MTPFDRFRAIPGSIDISIAQRMHLDQQILTTCNLRDLPQSPAISRNLSFVNCHAPAEAGGAFDKNGGTTQKNRVLPIAADWHRYASVGGRPAAI